MNNVGVIPVYYNNNLINPDFSKVNGLNFTGNSVIIEPPSLSFIGGIRIANIIAKIDTLPNVVGGIINVSQLNVSPGITTLGTLNSLTANFTGIVTASSFIGNIKAPSAIISGVTTSSTFKTTSLILTSNNTSNINSLFGNNCYFSGILTASKYSGGITANQSTVSGVATATQFFNGRLDGDNVTANSLNCGFASVGFITTKNVIHSGILTASPIITNNVNSNSVIVAGLTTVGILTGLTANFTGITTVGIITSINFTGSLTGPSSISGTVDISNTLFVGNNDSLLGQFKILPSTRRIVYVDGDIIRSDISDTGAASGITTEIWTDIWDNADVHQINRNGWTRGTAPNVGTKEYTVGTRQCFNNVRQAFQWLNGRNSSNSSPIEINLYKTSSSNEGLTLSGGPTAQCYYVGTTTILIKRGNTQPRLSISGTTYPWGPEHYTGHFDTPYAQIILYEANLNCSGILSNSDRYTSTAYYFIACQSLTITTSRCKFIYDFVDAPISGSSGLTFGLMFYCRTQNEELNTIRILFQKNPNIYSAFSTQNTNDFIFHVLNSNNITPFYISSLFTCSRVFLDTRRGEAGFPSSANLNIKIKCLNQASVFVFFGASHIFQLDGYGVSGSNSYYGGINLNFDYQESIFNNPAISDLVFIQSYERGGSRIVYIFDPDNIYSPISINLSTINNSNNNPSSFYGISAQITGYEIAQNTNNQSFIRKLVNAVPNTIPRIYSILGAGGVINNQFYPTLDVQTP